MRTPRLPFIRGLVPSTLCALALAACGGGGGDAPPSPAPGGTPTVVPLAGSATQSGCIDGSAASARFGDLQGIAIDDAGNIYVADRGCNALRRIDANGTVSTFAGVMGQAGDVPGAQTISRFTRPHGLAIDANGSLVMSDAGTHRVLRIATDGSVTRLLGTGRAGPLPLGGNVSSLTGALNVPEALAIRAGEVLFVDAGNRALRRFEPDTRRLITHGSVGQTDAVFLSPIAGTRVFTNGHAVSSERDDSNGNSVAGQFAAGDVATPGATDGAGDAVRFTSPSGLASDRQQRSGFYVADAASIREFDERGNVRTLLRGIDAIAGTPRALATTADGQTFFFTTATAVVRVARP